MAIFDQMRFFSVFIKKLVPDVTYLLKCLIGVGICYWLYVAIPRYPFYWAIISVVLAISPDNTNRMAYDRMKANLLGCATGLGLYFLHLPDFPALVIGITLVISIGMAAKMPATIRSALSALIIVIINERKQGEWDVPIQRVICVVVGCLVALLLTLVFNVITKTRRGLSD
jgi:uncharacterized membrane protein YccC